MCLGRKKGQAAGAAVLLAIIAGMLILFVLFIPPADRAELLGESLNTSSGGSRSAADVEKVFLDESPGRIDFLAQQEVEHPLPVINIFTRTEARILAEKNNALAKRSVFTEEVSTFPFSLENLAYTDNAILTFSVDRIEGELKITLNEQEIFVGAVSSRSNQPITIPRSLLRQENTMVFAVSSPGLAFWRTNEAALKNIKVIGDVTNTEAQQARSTFLISETEISNLEKLELRFQPGCNLQEVGPLRISVNGREIYNAVPDCDLAFVPIEISPDTVEEGENEILFKTVRGTYLLSHVMVLSELKEVDFPTYFFEVSLEDYNAIQNGQRRARVHLAFVDVVVRKSGELVVNGVPQHFDTKEAAATIDISEEIVRGTNSIKIKPRKTLEIRQLKVEYVR